jgi:hypothetical protein
VATAAQDDQHVEEMLGVYVLGALPADEEAAVATHLATCPRCELMAFQLHAVRAAFDRISPRGVASLLAEPGAGPASPSKRDGSARRIGPSAPTAPTGRTHPVGRGAAHPTKRRWSLPVRLVLAAVALALVTGVGIGTWLGTRGPVDVHLAGSQTDTQTGVSLQVTVVTAAHGSRVEATFFGLTAGKEYRLYAVGNRGESELAVDWTASGGTEGVAGDVTLSADRVTSVTATRANGSVLVTVRLTRSTG